METDLASALVPLDALFPRSFRGNLVFFLRKLLVGCEEDSRQIVVGGPFFEHLFWISGTCQIRSDPFEKVIADFTRYCFAHVLLPKYGNEGNPSITGPSQNPVRP